MKKNIFLLFVGFTVFYFNVMENGVITGSAIASLFYIIVDGFYPEKK